jgi:hypothetical protein
MFKEKFGTESTYIPEQKGNYRETLRENDDTCDRLGWKPEDRLLNYMKLNSGIDEHTIKHRINKMYYQLPISFNLNSPGNKIYNFWR